MALLKTEQQSGEMTERIGDAFEVSDHWDGAFSFMIFFEHGQHWIENTDTGRVWSVVDAEGGPAIDGFDFEVITEGEEHA